MSQDVANYLINLYIKYGSSAAFIFGLPTSFALFCAIYTRNEVLNIQFEIFKLLLSVKRNPTSSKTLFIDYCNEELIFILKWTDIIIHAILFIGGIIFAIQANSINAAKTLSEFSEEEKTNIVLAMLFFFSIIIYGFLECIILFLFKIGFSYAKYTKREK